jgi:hypothetical protein
VRHFARRLAGRICLSFDLVEKFIKLFFSLINEVDVCPLAIVNDNHKCLMHLSRAPLKGRLLAIPTNIRLGLRGLPGINTFVYYEYSLITAVKSFIAVAPGGKIYKTSFI